MNGFINVLKSVGATASDVVVCLKHVLGQKKIGHLGTLDPGASGVLPIAVGQATRLFDYLTDKQKRYRAFITFGKTTDTLDAYGKTLQTSSLIPSQQAFAEALGAFVGEQMQVPPQYSALSVGGVRAYKLARQGEEVALKARPITVYAMDYVRQFAQDTFVFDVTCSGGTYIRSLVRDIASHLGSVAYMSGLIRLQSGCFTYGNAYTLDEIRQMGSKCLLDVQYPLVDVPTATFPDALFDDIDNGRRVKCDFGSGLRRIYCKNVFFGLGCADGGILRLKYYLKNAVIDG